MAGDAGEHHRTDLLSVVEREDKIGPPVADKDAVRSALAIDPPSGPLARGEYSARPH